MEKTTAKGVETGAAARSSLAEGLDAGFIRRVMRTTAVVAALLALMVSQWLGWRVSLGLLVGAAVGIGSLASIEWMVRQFARPGRGSQRWLGVLLFAKIPLLAAALWLIVWAARASLPAVAGVVAGVALVPAVIVLKIVGLWLIAQPMPPPGGYPGEGRRNRG